MKAFTYDAIPGRVVFGAGSRHQLAAEAEALGSRRILLVASTHENDLAADVGAILGDLVVARFDDVVQHVPIPKANDAIALTKEHDVDTVVTIGGGSATGFGKAISLQVDVRQIALPTTYAQTCHAPSPLRSIDRLQHV